MPEAHPVRVLHWSQLDAEQKKKTHRIFGKLQSTAYSTPERLVLIRGQEPVAAIEFDDVGLLSRLAVSKNAVLRQSLGRTSPGTELIRHMIEYAGSSNWKAELQGSGLRLANQLRKRHGIKMSLIGPRQYSLNLASLTSLPLTARAEWDVRPKPSTVKEQAYRPANDKYYEDWRAKDKYG